jgi:hypothetical protein
LATTGRGDHEVHKGHVVTLGGDKKLISFIPIKLSNILDDPLAVSLKMIKIAETCSRV